MTLFERFLKMINHILDVFEKQPVVESSEDCAIERKYPKYLARYKLINLQFNDIQFRQTFMVQILILFQSLRQPINIIQNKYFANYDKKKMNKTRSRVHKILYCDYDYDTPKNKSKEINDNKSESSHGINDKIEGTSSVG